MPSKQMAHSDMLGVRIRRLWQRLLGLVCRGTFQVFGARHRRRHDYVHRLRLVCRILRGVAPTAQDNAGYDDHAHRRQHRQQAKYQTSLTKTNTRRALLHLWVHSILHLEAE